MLLPIERDSLPLTMCNEVVFRPVVPFGFSERQSHMILAVYGETAKRTRDSETSSRFWDEQSFADVRERNIVLVHTVVYLTSKLHSRLGAAHTGSQQREANTPVRSKNAETHNWTTFMSQQRLNEAEVNEGGSSVLKLCRAMSDFTHRELLSRNSESLRKFLGGQRPSIAMQNM